MPMTQTYQDTLSDRPAEGCSRNSRAPRPAVIAAAQAHSRPRMGWPKTREARIRVSGSSRIRIGSTTDSSPLPSAVAWSRKPAQMAAMPPNHTGWCSRLAMSRQLRFCCLGTVRLARRCSTDDVAFAQAASTART